MSVRSYEVVTSVNDTKLAAVAGLLVPWQAALVEASRRLVREFYRSGELPRWVCWDGYAGLLSARQLDSVGQQAHAAHVSWLGNCERVFRDLVVNSSLTGDVRDDLLYVNKARLWFLPTVDCRGNVLDDEFLVPVVRPSLAAKRRVDAAAAAAAGEPSKQYRARCVPVSTLRLARAIMGEVTGRVGRPRLGRVRTMVMDGKVANVQPAERATMPGAFARDVSWWARISTLESGRPVWVPFHSHEHLDARLSEPGAVLANHVDVVVSRPDRHGHVTVAFRVLVKQPDVVLRRDDPDHLAALTAAGTAPRSLALDWGLVNLFASSDGNLLGQSFYRQLRTYDTRLQQLVKALAVNGVRPNQSRRYRALVARLRGYVTNEINRVLNRVAADPSVCELVVEDLDLRGSGLSRRLRRLVSNAGRGAVARKLADLEERHGIQIVEVNPAHTSRECPCGFTDKNNRRTQAEFRCRFCGHTSHADVAGARTLLRRSQQGRLYRGVGKHQVLSDLDHRFCERWGITATKAREHPRAPERLAVTRQRQTDTPPRRRLSTIPAIPGGTQVARVRPDTSLVA